jgi:hypothetical protein
MQAMPGQVKDRQEIGGIENKAASARLIHVSTKYCGRYRQTSGRHKLITRSDPLQPRIHLPPYDRRKRADQLTELPPAHGYLYRSAPTGFSLLFCPGKTQKISVVEANANASAIMPKVI